MTSTHRADESDTDTNIDTDWAFPLQRGVPLTPPAWSAPAEQAPQRPARSDVTAVQASLAAVRRRPIALAQCFYAHLFEMAPAMRPMFADDMTAQMQRMCDVLLATIGALEDPADQPALERSLRALGVRHRDHFHVRPEQYVYIAHALTRAVRDIAGAAWSGSLSSSWVGLTMWIIGQMLVGHHGDASRR
jgi:hemoglobin-like flavoprotein